MDGGLPILMVVAAVVVRDGRLLLTLRGAGSPHLADHWELPGGKVEPGENPPAALRREIAEELAVEARVGAPLAFNYHEYPSRRVLLLAYRAEIQGEPRAAGCADLGWFTASQIAGLATPAADAPIFERVIPLLALLPPLR